MQNIVMLGGDGEVCEELKREWLMQNIVMLRGNEEVCDELRREWLMQNIVMLRGDQSINQSINQVYFQINMYKNEQKVHISQIDRKKVEVEVNNL